MHCDGCLRSYFQGILLSVAVLLLGCRNSQVVVNESAQPLKVTVVDVSYLVNYSGELTGTVLTPVPDISVFVEANQKTYTGKTNAQGLAEFPNVFPVTAAPVAVGAAAPEGGAWLQIVGWQLPELILPVGGHARILKDVPVDTSQITTILGRIAGWTASAIGETSQAIVASRALSGRQAAATLQATSDTIARSELSPGSGTANCLCVNLTVLACLDIPGNGAAQCPCDKEDVVCSDPDGFSAGAAGITLFVPQETSELGFVEVIVEQETGQFIDVGNAYYTSSLDLASVSTLAQVLTPDIPPNFDKCPDNGQMKLNLDGLGRKYVLQKTGGLNVSTWLESTGGLRLPINDNTLWRQNSVMSVSTQRQQLWIGQPFDLEADFAGFSYGFALHATSSGTGLDGITRYEYIVSASAQVTDQNICTTAIDMSTFEVDFLEPTAILPLGTEISKIGEVGRRNMISIRDISTGVTRGVIVDLVGDDLLNLASWQSLTPAEYELEYRVLNGSDPVDASWLTGTDVLSSADSYIQKHQFAVK